LAYLVQDGHATGLSGCGGCDGSVPMKRIQASILSMQHWVVMVDERKKVTTKSACAAKRGQGNRNKIG